MVNSYTALRTHIKLLYGKSATLVRQGNRNGLLVSIPRDACTAEDQLCYGCEQTDSGTLFTLDSIGVKPRDRKTRLLPATLNSFLSRCIKDNIVIKRQDTHEQTTPQLLASQLDGDLIINDRTSTLLANYSTIDIVLDPEHEYRLAKLNYVKSSKSEGVYRVILKVSKRVQIQTEDLLLLLEEVVTEEWSKEGWSWKGWGKKEVEKMVRDGMSVMLFQPIESAPEGW